MRRGHHPSGYDGTGRRLFTALHQEDFHKFVEVAVEDALGVGGFVAGAEVFDHLVGMKDIAADLGAPLDFLFLALKFSLFCLAFLEFDVIETGFEDAQGIVPVVVLGAGFGVFNYDTARYVADTDSCLDLVHVLSAGTA